MENQEIKNILYELLINVEWSLEPDFIGEKFTSQGGSIFYRTFRKTPSNLLSILSYIYSYIGKNYLSTSLSRILESGSEWQVAIGAQGAVLAVLQNTCLEIRAKKDDYASTVGKNTNLYFDPFPSWRKVCWSSDCSMIAVGYSNGTIEIFNTVGVSLFMIYPPRFQESKIQVDTTDSLAALFFSESRTQQMKWTSELILVSFQGEVRGYYVSATEGYQESQPFSLHKMHPFGITAAASVGALLVVAGSCRYLDDSSLKNNGIGHGLSIWRMINDYPYYKQVPTVDEEDYYPPNQGLLSHLPLLSGSSSYDSIFTLRVSPLGRQIVALHASGSLSIWDLPSLRKRKFWSLDNQTISDQHSPVKKPNLKLFDLQNHIADVRWWSEEALIIARYSGAVTICSTDSLANLLGDSPEFFEGVPEISDAFDKSFLGIEIEKRVLRNKTISLPAEFSESVLDDSEEQVCDEEDESELSAVQRSRLVFNTVMFWVTDAERFRPPNKRNRIVSRTARLLCLKSTTPAELFGRKIEAEEYGEALALAQKYDLDCDFVHQQQWRKNSVTVTTIQDYLYKIKKRSWVLMECLNRVPEDIDAARELILYGLRGTDLDTLVLLCKDPESDEYLVSDLSLEFEEDIDMDPVEVEALAQEWAAEDLKKRRNLLSQIDFKNLNALQISVIKARQKLLTYFDRLSAYEVLLGGSAVAADRFDSKVYETFRQQTEIEAAIEFARNYNWLGVETMFTFHGKSTLPHRLAILSCFPATMVPFEYKSLLPECDLSGEIFEWEQDSLRDEDWCEDSFCKKAAGVEDYKAIDTLYEENADFVQFRGKPLTFDFISSWYIWRAKDIEKTSQFVDSALEFIKFGRERNIAALDELQDMLELLEILVYEVSLPKISLKQLENLEDLEKFKLLMSTTTLDTFLANIRRWGLPFLRKLDKKEPGVGNQLLKDYLVFSSEEDLSYALKTVQHSHKDQPDPIVSETEKLMEIVIDCIYACQKENQLPRSFAMLEFLPMKENRRISAELNSLYIEIDQLDDHLFAAELLSSHGILVSPATVKEIQEDEKRIRLLLTRLARTASRKATKLPDSEWQKLLNDMLELRQRIFDAVSPKTCFEILTEALLTSGVRDYINFARDLMVTSQDRTPIRNPYLQKINYDKAVRLVIKAATEYFNASENFFDSTMELARFCLDIIESDDEELNREQDLIASLEILPDIGIHKLPLQVRLCENRLDLIKDALKTNPDNHIYGSRILRLADLLRIAGDDIDRRKGEIYALLAESAYQVNDLSASCHWCCEIRKVHFSDGWSVCYLLGRCPRVTDLNLRIQFLDFALTYAAPEHLEDLLIVRNHVELLTLTEKVNQRIDTSSVSLDSEEGFQDAKEHSSSEEEEEWSETHNETPVNPSRLLSLPLNFTKTVLSTTSSLVSHVATKKLWQNATSFLRPMKGLTLTISEEESSESQSNCGFEKQGCHAFLTDFYPQGHLSQLGVTYKSYASPVIQNSALDVSWTMFRIGLIEETLRIGNFFEHYNANIIEQVIKGFLAQDWLLGMSLLDQLNAEHAHKVLSSLPRTEITLQTILFYHAQQLYRKTHSERKETAGLDPVLVCNPIELIDWGSQFCVEEEHSDDSILFHSSKFKETEKILSDYSQAQMLQKLGAGINMERFLNDAEYKKDSVLGLAMFVEVDVFNLAVQLATKYNVSIWQVYMTHIQFLFDSEVSTKELEELIDSRKLKDKLKANPNEFVSAMDKNVLFTINGSDHDRLILYYSLLTNWAKDSNVKKLSKIHIESLKKVKQVAYRLDYKLFFEDSSRNVIEILKPHLFEENVHVLASVCKDLNKYNPKTLDSSVVYCAWAQRQFFDRRPRNTHEWIQRYKSTEEIFKEMKASEVNSLIKTFVSSLEASKNIPLEARKEIIKRAAAYCKNKLNDLKESAREKENWSSVSSSLEKLENHLGLTASQAFKQLMASTNPQLVKYAQKFAESGGDDVLLQNLSHEVLYDLCSMDTLRSLLSVYSDHEIIPEDIFSQVFNSNIEKMQEQNNESNLEEELALLDHLLKELISYTEDGGELLQEEIILEQLREFSHDNTFSVDSRIKVFSLAKKYLPLTEEDSQYLQNMQTGGIVSAAFKAVATKENQSIDDSLSEKVTPDQIGTEEGRMNLFESLLKRMDSKIKVQSIIDLLNIWPSFTSEIYDDVSTNPWNQAFGKLFSLLKSKKEAKNLDLIPLVYSSCLDAIARNELPDECLRETIENILSTPCDNRNKICAKIAFNSSSMSSQAIVIDVYQKLNKIENHHYDDELLDVIMKKKLVSKIVSTCLYGPLISYLNENGSDEQRMDVVSQLKAGNHWIEAASLAMLSSTLPRSLQIASNAFRMFKS